MKKATENTRTRTTATTLSAPTVSERISKSVIVGFFGVSGLIGLWSIAAFTGALITTGPAAMFRGFVTALLGG